MRYIHSGIQAERRASIWDIAIFMQEKYLTIDDASYRCFAVGFLPTSTHIWSAKASYNISGSRTIILLQKECIDK